MEWVQAICMYMVAVNVNKDNSERDTGMKSISEIWYEH